MPLQKASSDHFGYLRKHQGRTQWQRSKSSGYAQTTSRPLLPVSEKTKNKLNQFQFSDNQATPDETSEPHADAVVAGEGYTSEIHHEQRPNEKDAKHNTPTGRVSLRDLLAKDASQPKQDDSTRSPEERIEWGKGERRHAQALSLAGPRQRRKRARSSSPMSSPAQDGLTNPAPHIDRKKLTEALRSPHTDPTLQLWDRLSIGNTPNNATPSGPRSTGLADLMVSSSPRPPKMGQTPVNGAPGFRRALSSGLCWPKRRKVDHSGSTATPETLTNRDGSKSSLVTALLDTVDTKEDASPGDAGPAHRIPMESPSPRKRRTADPADSPSRRLKSRPSPTKRDQTRELGVERLARDDGDAESDYGDDGFLDDEDTLMQLDASIMATQPQTADHTVPPASTPPPNAGRENSAQTVEDEFGDLDDDNILAAAVGMVADIESTNRASVPASTRQPTTQTKEGPDNNNDYDDDDDFGDDFGEDFDFEAAEFAATQAAGQTNLSSLPATSQKPRSIQRYLVTNVLDNEYSNEQGQSRLEKILLVQVENTKASRTVHLRGEWHDTPVHAKSYVHIIGAFTLDGRCIIDDDRNILILHPDQLVSATVVADSFTCMRRAVLQDRVKATSEATKPLVYGTVLHEIFQAALLANRWDLDYLDTVIDTVLEKHIEDLYKIRVSIQEAKEHLLSKMPELSGWAKTFVASQPKPNALVSDRNGKKANMCVSKLLDVEEHVWSPMYGLKGNIDATIQVTMKDGPDSRVLTVPFEVKTGKNVSVSHTAQTALYNLLLSDRYDIEVVYGILYYMESSRTDRIPAIRHELRQLIMQRNRLACYIRERSVKLPEMKRSKHTCKNCYAKTSCFVYHKLADNGDGVTSDLGAQFDEVVGHLNPSHQDFFVKWEDLLTKEEKESQKLKRELWTMVGKDRERLGRAFADVVIEEGSWSEDLDSPNINRFRYTFNKRDRAPGHSFMESQLAVGEPIVVSDEKGHFALALGYVTSVRKQKISVAVDRRLHNARVRQPGFDENRNQVFAGIMEVQPEGCAAGQTQGKMKTEPIRYRLDKDEFSNGMATVRNNLVQIMANEVFGSQQIRRLVVDLEAPKFKTAPTQYQIMDRDSLNVDQQQAIQKVMSAEDYALVLGMPGTGKTTTIAHIIRALASQGKQVLLTSYTHTAVDNILLKLKHENIPILRLGAPAKVHPEVQQFATLASVPMNSFDEIRKAWHDTPIVATTCLGIGHPLFHERTFDYCIVDEASQITLPICLGPIRMAKTFVLVGDHNQLPPLVQNEEARDGGLDISLFKLLSDTHPDSVINLEHQYRMCEDIMTLSNTLIYKGRLRCGTKQLRKTSLRVSNMSALKHKHYDADSLLRPGTPRSFCKGPRPSSCWLRDLLDPETRVSFVNTDTLQQLGRVAGAREEAKGNRIVNPAEARIVTQLVDALVTVGVPEADIGVMTHYRSQLSLLKHGLRGLSSVEMHTADRFQGRDKEVVVLSLVRSNEAGAIGELLRDWRRINVAFTRAKTKLLVVGSRGTLKGSDSGPSGKGGEEMVSQFVGLMESRRWVYDLPADALESHFFDEVGTQGTAVTGGPSPSKTTSAMSPTDKTKTKMKRMSQGLFSGDKENRRPEPRRAMAGEKVLTKNRPVTRDILNDISDGRY